MAISHFRRYSEVRSKLTGKGNQGTLVAPPLLIILPLLNAFNRTLGIENYGFGFLEVRGFMGALYLRNCSAKVNFISRPMMICRLVVGCSPTCYSQTLHIQHRGLPLIITRCEKYKEIYGLGVRRDFSSLQMDFQAWGSQ
jgi:hypothetical protein